MAARLRAGAIVAVKGLGGFHLACDAADERAVAALRARKHREDKPFALMVADVDAARRLVALDAGAGGAARLVARGRSCWRRAAPTRRSRPRSPAARRSSA